MVTPIFLLGYRPLTFERPPPTSRDGPDDRISSISDRADSARASFWNHTNRSSCPSIVGTSIRSAHFQPRQHCSLLQRRAPFPLLSTQVTHPSFLDKVFQSPALLDGFLNLRSQLFWHVDRESAIRLVTGKSIAAVAFARCTGRAVIPNARALPQGNRTHRYRPQIPDRVQEPSPDIFRSFVLTHRMCAL